MSLLVGVMILQPSVLTFGLMDQNCYVLTDIDSDEDTSKKEVQEDDSTDEIKELQTALLSDSESFDTKRMVIFSDLANIRGISLEIHIPPPEQA
jgi:hypothetical protein